MTSIVEIEKAIEKLSRDDLMSFRAWFERFEAERFDRAIEDDAGSGRLDGFADEVRAEAHRGGLREL